MLLFIVVADYELRYSGSSLSPAWNVRSRLLSSRGRKRNEVSDDMLTCVCFSICIEQEESKILDDRLHALLMRMIEERKVRSRTIGVSTAGMGNKSGS